MKALVTGGGGFLGEGIVRQLLQRGDTVRILARGDYPALRALGVETLRGDLRDPQAVERACQGVDLVFHTAAKAGIWGDPAEFEGINLIGTRNVIAACRKARVPHLVYTSSPSVVHGGSSQEGIDETTPYPAHFHADYPRTKALAEQEVIAANSADLLTVSLRPHLIWGPGDPHILPRLAAQAKAGKLRRIGFGDPLIDSTYIDNAVEAHLQAADRLRAGAPIGGRVYFITNGEPMGCWTLVNRLLEASNAPQVTRAIPVWLAWTAGAVLESAYRLFGLAGEPRLTRFVATEMSTAHWFDLSAAGRDLGYAPKVSIEEGLKRLQAWNRERGAR